MLAEIKPLIKKDFIESVNNFKAKKGALGVFGYITYFLFVAVLFATVIFIYSYLSSSYVNISSQLDFIYLRQKELLTITLLVILLFNVFSGTIKIYKKLFTGEVDKLSVLPVSSKDLFVYKILYIFTNQFVSNLVTILMFGISFGVVCQMGVLYYFMMALAVLIFPFISTGLATLFVIPYYYFVKFTHSKYFLLIVIYAILFAAGFAVYSILLEALNNVLVSGGLKNFFNEQTFNFIATIASYSFPCNLIANFMLGESVLINIAVCLLMVLSFVFIILVVVGKCYPYLSNDSKEEKSVKFLRPQTFKQKGVFHTLLNKEFVSIFRKPSFAFSLFSVSLTLPLLVLLCTRLLSLLVNNIVYVNINFVISLFVVSMFALLTNTFCASNVSREGKTFYKQMLLPITNFQILLPKVFACFVVSAFSIIISCVVLVVAGYISIVQALLITFIVVMLCLAENLFATKHDLLKPTLSKVKNSEFEATQSSDLVALLSFVITSLIMGSILLYNVLMVLKGQSVSLLVIYLLPCLVSVVLLALAVIYFTYKLNNIKMVEN